MGLSWQQGPLSPGAIGRFLVPEPLPQRLLYAEPLRRRMVAYFPETDVSPRVLEPTDHTTRHSDLGPTSWYTVRAGEHTATRGAWQHTGLPAHASELQARVPFASRALDAFYEEDQRIVGHAAHCYHRIDIRQASRNLVVRHRDRMIAETTRPLVLYESGFAPRWYVLRADIDKSALTPVEHQTFCPYKGLCSYYNIGYAHLAAWSYPDAYPEVGRMSIPHGPDRDLTVSEAVRPADGHEREPEATRG